jgi:lincosamide nucleotidyltransferase A/C/D/E
MPIANVLLVLDKLHSAGVETVVMGGWGIDALVGEQRREHRDLDLILDHADLELALATLATLGFREWFRNPNPKPYAGHGIEGDVVVLRDQAMQVVDLHPMCLRSLTEGVAVGSIAGQDVTCVSAGLQIEALRCVHTRSRRGRRRHEANLATAQQALERRVAA